MLRGCFYVYFSNSLLSIALICSLVFLRLRRPVTASIANGRRTRDGTAGEAAAYDLGQTGCDADARHSQDPFSSRRVCARRRFFHPLPFGSDGERRRGETPREDRAARGCAR